MFTNRFRFTVAAIAIVLAVGLATSFAQGVSRSVVLSRQAKLGGNVLAQGRYSVVFDEKKSGAVSVLRDGREVVKASYKLLELPKDAPDTAVVYSAGADGSFQVRRIELKGLKVALQFE